MPHARRLRGLFCVEGALMGAPTGEFRTDEARQFVALDGGAVGVALPAGRVNLHPWGHTGRKPLHHYVGPQPFYKVAHQAHILVQPKGRG